MFMVPRITQLFWRWCCSATTGFCGLKRNYKSLDTFLRYHYEQRPRNGASPEDLLLPETLDD